MELFVCMEACQTHCTKLHCDFIRQPGSRARTSPRQKLRFWYTEHVKWPDRETKNNWMTEQDSWTTLFTEHAHRKFLQCYCVKVIVQRSLCRGHHTKVTVQRSSYNGHCAEVIIQRLLYKGHCIKIIVQRSLNKGHHTKAIIRRPLCYKEIGVRCFREQSGRSSVLHRMWVVAVRLLSLFCWKSLLLVLDICQPCLSLSLPLSVPPSLSLFLCSRKWWCYWKGHRCCTHLKMGENVKIEVQWCRSIGEFRSKQIFLLH